MGYAGKGGRDQDRRGLIGESRKRGFRSAGQNLQTNCEEVGGKQSIH
jgi:hypothetical protein